MSLKGEDIHTYIHNMYIQICMHIYIYIYVLLGTNDMSNNFSPNYG